MLIAFTSLELAKFRDRHTGYFVEWRNCNTNSLKELSNQNSSNSFTSSDFASVFKIETKATLCRLPLPVYAAKFGQLYTLYLKP